MVLGPLVGIPPFEPIAQTTPMSYRDLDTNISILKKHRDKIDEIIDALNALSLDNTSEHNRIVLDLTTQFNNALTALQSELETRITDISADASSATDPTTGQRNTALTQVINNVYDNARVFAWFAVEADTLGHTAAEWDALNMSARHFDLGATYPVIHDALP